MKKLVSLLALLLLLLPLSSLLVSCHGSRGLDEFVMPSVFDESKNYEITFWAKNDTNKTQTEIYKKAISDFEEIYPNITVNLRLYTDYNKIYNDVITNISTGTTPNVCITYPDHIATYLTGTNVVVPLDDLMDNEKYGLGGSEVKFDSVEKDEIIPQFLNEGRINGLQYALPFMRSTEACYVNKTYVEKLGYTLPDTLTWDFIWEVSDAAAEKDENGVYYVNGQNVMLPFIYKSTDNMMIQSLYQKNAGYTNSDGDILLFNDTTSEILADVKVHTETGAFSTFKISGYPANFLNAGQCIFAIDSTAGATWMGTDAPLSDISEESIVSFETVVMSVPQYDTSNPKMISQGPSVCIFNKQDSDEVLASWLFTQFLLTNDVQISYSETEGYVPVTSKAQSSDEYIDYLSRAGEDTNEHYYVKIEAAKLLLDNIDNTFVTPVWNGSTSLRTAAGDLIESVVKSVRRRETIDDAYFDKLKSNVISLYRLDSRQSSAGGKTELGPLPTEAKVLLVSLGAAWVFIIAYAAHGLKRRGK